MGQSGLVPTCDIRVLGNGKIKKQAPSEPLEMLWLALHLYYQGSYNKDRHSPMTLTAIWTISWQRAMDHEALVPWFVSSQPHPSRDQDLFEKIPQWAGTTQSK